MANHDEENSQETGHHSLSGVDAAMGVVEATGVHFAAGLHNPMLSQLPLNAAIAINLAIAGFNAKARGEVLTNRGICEILAKPLFDYGLHFALHKCNFPTGAILPLELNMIAAKLLEPTADWLIKEHIPSIERGYWEELNNSNLSGSERLYILESLIDTGADDLRRAAYTTKVFAFLYDKTHEISNFILNSFLAPSNIIPDLALLLKEKLPKEVWENPKPYLMEGCRMIKRLATYGYESGRIAQSDFLNMPYYPLALSTAPGFASIPPSLEWRAVANLPTLANQFASSSATALSNIRFSSNVSASTSQHPSKLQSNQEIISPLGDAIKQGKIPNFKPLVFDLSPDIYIDIEEGVIDAIIQEIGEYVVDWLNRHTGQQLCDGEFEINGDRYTWRVKTIPSLHEIADVSVTNKSLGITERYEFNGHNLESVTVNLKVCMYQTIQSTLKEYPDRYPSTFNNEKTPQFPIPSKLIYMTKDTNIGTLVHNFIIATNNKLKTIFGNTDDIDINQINELISEIRSKIPEWEKYKKIENKLNKKHKESTELRNTIKVDLWDKSLIGMLQIFEKLLQTHKHNKILTQETEIDNLIRQINNKQHVHENSIKLKEALEKAEGISTLSTDEILVLESAATFNLSKEMGMLQIKGNLALKNYNAAEEKAKLMFARYPNDGLVLALYFQTLCDREKDENNHQSFIKLKTLAQANARLVQSFPEARQLYVYALYQLGDIETAYNEALLLYKEHPNAITTSLYLLGLSSQEANNPDKVYHASVEVIADLHQRENDLRAKCQQIQSNICFADPAAAINDKSIHVYQDKDNEQWWYCDFSNTHPIPVQINNSSLIGLLEKNLSDGRLAPEDDAHLLEQLSHYIAKQEMPGETFEDINKNKEDASRICFTVVDARLEFCHQLVKFYFDTGIDNRVNSFLGRYFSSAAHPVKKFQKLISTVNAISPQALPIIGYYYAFADEAQKRMLENYVKIRKLPFIYDKKDPISDFIQFLSFTLPFMRQIRDVSFQYFPSSVYVIDNIDDAILALETYQVGHQMYLSWKASNSLNDQKLISPNDASKSSDLNHALSCLVIHILHRIWPYIENQLRKHNYSILDHRMYYIIRDFVFLTLLSAQGLRFFSGSALPQIEWALVVVRGIRIIHNMIYPNEIFVNGVQKIYNFLAEKNYNTARSVLDNISSSLYEEQILLTRKLIVITEEFDEGRYTSIMHTSYDYAINFIKNHNDSTVKKLMAGIANAICLKHAIVLLQQSDYAKCITGLDNLIDIQSYLSDVIESKWTVFFLKLRKYEKQSRLASATYYSEQLKNEEARLTTISHQKSSYSLIEAVLNLVKENIEKRIAEFYKSTNNVISENNSLTKKQGANNSPWEIQLSSNSPLRLSDITIKRVKDKEVVQLIDETALIHSIELLHQGLEAKHWWLGIHYLLLLTFSSNEDIVNYSWAFIKAALQLNKITEKPENKRIIETLSEKLKSITIPQAILELVKKHDEIESLLSDLFKKEGKKNIRERARRILSSYGYHQEIDELHAEIACEDPIKSLLLGKIAFLKAIVCDKNETGLYLDLSHHYGYSFTGASYVITQMNDDSIRVDNATYYMYEHTFNEHSFDAAPHNEKVKFLLNLTYDDFRYYNTLEKKLKLFSDKNKNIARTSLYNVPDQDVTIAKIHHALTNYKNTENSISDQKKRRRELIEKRDCSFYDERNHAYQFKKRQDVNEFKELFLENKSKNQHYLPSELLRYLFDACSFKQLLAISSDYFKNYYFLFLKNEGPWGAVNAEKNSHNIAFLYHAQLLFSIPTLFMLSDYMKEMPSLSLKLEAHAFGLTFKYSETESNFRSWIKHMAPSGFLTQYDRFAIDQNIEKLNQAGRINRDHLEILAADARANIVIIKAGSLASPCIQPEIIEFPSARKTLYFGRDLNGVLYIFEKEKNTVPPIRNIDKYIRYPIIVNFEDILKNNRKLQSISSTFLMGASHMVYRYGNDDALATLMMMISFYIMIYMIVNTLTKNNKHNHFQFMPKIRMFPIENKQKFDTKKQNIMKKLTELDNIVIHERDKVGEETLLWSFLTKVKDTINSHQTHLNQLTVEFGNERLTREIWKNFKHEIEYFTNKLEKIIIKIQSNDAISPRDFYEDLFGMAIAPSSSCTFKR